MGLLFLYAMLAACSKDAVTGNDAVRTGPEETMSHGMIVLGDRLENPYTTGFSIFSSLMNA